MYNPKQNGWFPLIQLKIEEGLSDTDKEAYLKLKTLQEKVQWLHSLPRISSDQEDNVLRHILKVTTPFAIPIHWRCKWCVCMYWYHANTVWQCNTAVVVVRYRC